MSNQRLHPDTRLGYVHLTVSDMARAREFYQLYMGFRLLANHGDQADFGVGSRLLVRLTERRSARRMQGTTGLYHFAIRVPSRFDLARSLYHLLQGDVRVAGGDHGVSEAIYFDDPDGNGIEIYRDRPRDTWTFSNGALNMGTDRLDFSGILGELGDAPPTWTGLAAGTDLGHMHLHVAHLPAAEAFWRDAIGLDLMVRYGGTASFLSAGGYHHHLGINVWAGVGAPTPPPESIGLRYFTVNLAAPNERDLLTDRLRAHAIPFSETEDGIEVRDPSGNTVRLA